MSYAIAATSVCLVAYLVTRKLRRVDADVKLPPGPKGLPVLGNLLDVPLQEQWLTYSKWGKTYGDIIFLDVLGQALVVLNSYEDADEVLNKRGVTSSDRPVFVMGGELVGWRQSLAMTPYGGRSTEMRTLLRKYIGQDKLKNVASTIDLETHRLLQRLVKNPNHPVDSLQQFDGLSFLGTIGSIILQVSYGYDPEKEDGHLVKKIVEAVKVPSEDVVKWAALSLYSGGSDTTAATLQWLILAVVLHPDIQIKAQAEIERVVGHDRLPTIEDRKQLPYIDALVKELLRWRPIGPLGLPHRLTRSETYQGFTLPKGAIVLADIWQMCHNPKDYPNPEVFNPDRFLNSEAKDPKSVVFGFGLRICPGMHLADHTLWMVCARILATMVIEPYVDPSTGRKVIPQPQTATGVIAHPEPFNCTIRPRSQKAIELINTVELQEG